MSIADPYVQSRQKPKAITLAAVQKDEARLAPQSPPIPRPRSGPKCITCGKELYHYDIPRGECFTHPVARIRAARKELARVPVTDEATRRRTRESAKRRKS
jgi:hypothetical protein